MKLTRWMIALVFSLGTPVGAFATPPQMPLGGNQIKMRFEDPVICNPGILELIGLEMEEFAVKGHSAAVLFSLEPVGGGAGHSFVFMQSGSLGMPPQDFEVPVKRDSSPTLMGLYLCLDSTGRGSCGAKTAGVFNQNMRRYQVTRDEAGNALRTPELRDPQSFPEEKNYFFQPLLIEAGAVKLLPTPLPSTPPPNVMKLISPEKWRLWVALSDQLQSPPLSIKEGRLIISLPRFSPEACAAARAREKASAQHHEHHH